MGLMTLMPGCLVQCDHCLTSMKLVGKSADWGAEMFDAGWRARPNGRMKYKHACRMCADDMIAEHDRQ